MLHKIQWEQASDYFTVMSRTWAQHVKYIGITSIYLSSSLPGTVKFSSAPFCSRQPPRCAVFMTFLPKGALAGVPLRVRFHMDPRDSD